MRRPPLRREEMALAVAVRCQHRLDEAQDSAIGQALGHQREEFLVDDRPEEILQIRVDNPFSACFNFLPDPAEGVLCRSPASISEVGVIEYRLEDWLQSVEQCLLAYPIINRRDA